MKNQENWTSELIYIMREARQLAERKESRAITSEHFLACIIKLYTEINPIVLERPDLLEIFKAAQIDSQKIQERLYSLIDAHSKRPWFVSRDKDIIVSDAAGRMLDDLGVESRLSGKKPDVFHLLMAILKTDCPATTIMEEHGITYNTLASIEMVKNVFRSSKVQGKTEESEKPQSSFAEGADFEDADGGVQKKTIDTGAQKTNTPFLDQYSFDMTQAAKSGKFDPVVGRIKEVEQLFEILSCRKKNNAILLGDPGTGKTAVVEALAQRIVNLDIPKEFIGKRICSLDINAMISGTKYRGQFEERMQGVISEVLSHPEVIVYIDEFHNLIGSGSSSGNGDGANILKPYLARGEFQCIGSTTIEEYRKYVEKDGALKRRFQNIMISEPSEAETIDILEQLKPKYEEHHGVTYGPEIIKKCVEWSGRYITDRYFPDKAIDALDMVGSKTKLLASSSESDMDEYKKLQDQLNECNEMKVKCIKESDFEKAAEYRDQGKAIGKQIDDLLASRKVSDDSGTGKPEVELETLAACISKITSIPQETIGKTDMEKLRGIKGTLGSKVIGQPEAIEEVVLSLQRNSLGLRDPKKPIASLLLTGPTGSGKTYLCKTLATEFFGSPDALIRFDMSEFSEKHEITKLTGSTASYVGYDDTPLFDQIRRKPYSVVLFDEIEKADKAIYQVFLSILDEGFITLGNGVRVDFKNTIIIFTGNVGTKDLMLHGSGLGFGSPDRDKKKETTDIVMKAVKKTFSPEFINRLSKTIVFNELGHADMIKICDLEVQKLANRLRERGWKLDLSEPMKEFLVSKCDLKYGARDLQRNIIEFVEDPVCMKMLESKTEPKKKKIHVDLKGEEIEVKFG